MFLKKITITSILFLTTTLFVSAQKQVLLIGTFHFDNPGADAVKVKSVDILSVDSQKQLDAIAEKIGEFRPTKIFIEWNNKDQNTLDTLYQLYKAGKYDAYIKEKYKEKNKLDFFKKSELFQLGFRAGKKAGLDSICAFDYKMGLPFDTVMKVIQSAGQKTLMNDINNSMAKTAQDFNDKASKLNLLELIEDANTPQSRLENNGVYIKLLNRAGLQGNFAGADAVATWYKRNLYMYALVQKKILPKDERIMILVGAGHASMIEKFIKDENIFKVLELKDLMSK
jgi:hypothetical protein